MRVLHPTHDGSDATPDIYILGLGIRGLEQLTRETEAALRRSTRIFHMHPWNAVGSQLRSMGLETVDLQHQYSTLKDRSRTYEEISELVLAAALDRPPVALALYGHPTVYADPPQLILERAAAKNLTVRILPGVSCLDTIFADLNMDPAKPGLQVYEATALLVYQIPLVPQIPCMILQPVALESALYVPGRSRPERFLRLKSHLLKYYPEEHEVKICLSALTPTDPARISSVPLGDLESAFAEMSTSCTLYLGSHGKLSEDTELRSLMRSESHAKSLFYPSLLEAVGQLRDRAAERAQQ